jgi:hypothetical protein
VDLPLEHGHLAAVTRVFTGGQQFAAALLQCAHALRLRFVHMTTSGQVVRGASCMQARHDARVSRPMRSDRPLAT